MGSKGGQVETQQKQWEIMKLEMAKLQDQLNNSTDDEEASSLVVSHMRNLEKIQQHKFKEWELTNNRLKEKLHADVAPIVSLLTSQQAQSEESQLQTWREWEGQNNLMEKKLEKAR